MLPWQIWLIISGVCFIAEIATVGFLIFWFGVAALITCLLSLFISNGENVFRFRDARK